MVLCVAQIAKKFWQPAILGINFINTIQLKGVTMATEKVKRVQELRRSNAATPQKNKKKYTRKTKHKKNKTLKIFSDLVSPYFK